MNFLSRSFLFSIVSILFAVPAAAKSRTAANHPASISVEARKGIPVIYGKGSELIPQKVLKGKHKKFAEKTFGKGTDVGFYYETFHIFFVNFWTWGGKHVVISPDAKSYAEPSAKQWAQLAGKRGAEGLSKPFLYRFPGGLILIGLIIVGLGSLFMFVKPDGEEEPVSADDDSNQQAEQQQEHSALDAA